jgi:hypothetical protein
VSDVDVHGRTIGKCRWCDADVRWVVMVPSGKKNPLDPDPAPNGNVILEAHNTGLAKALRRGEPYEGPRYLSHWATCSKVARDRAAARQTRMFTS